MRFNRLLFNLLTTRQSLRPSPERALAPLPPTEKQIQVFKEPISRAIVPIVPKYEPEFTEKELETLYAMSSLAGTYLLAAVLCYKTVDGKTKCDCSDPASFLCSIRM